MALGGGAMTSLLSPYDPWWGRPLTIALTCTDVHHRAPHRSRAAHLPRDHAPVRPGRIKVMTTARRQATRQKLYAAAVPLIAEQGFSATTVDEIAERAGVAKGTVYYNFASKNDLF